LQINLKEGEQLNNLIWIFTIDQLFHF